MPTAPSLRRRRLAAELRKLREQSGLSVTDVAKRLDWQASRLSRLENRQSGISRPDLRRLLDLYQVEDEEYRAYLAELARKLNERGWWQKYAGDVITTGLAELISLEEEARTIRTYEQEVVPGLLQIPEYAQAIFRDTWPLNTAEQVKRKVEIRMERQQVLTRPDPPPPRLSVVLGEGVLRRPAGGREVMLRQLEHLLRLPRDHANVTIQVLPFAAGAHPAMVGSFTMLTFPDPDDLGMVNLESATSALFLEDPAEIRVYDEIWHTLQARALSPDDSQAFLRSTSFGYRLGEGREVTDSS
ncbi:MAG TPA: helix-turn-helix transcriptional regulator [Streptosporangiaceae bacterium]|jgi:transcriptional regulator with XRE-family HTH domain|nr:helix-turn-helix transcriptional regulator [Streptosporangiaceae bacterium]